ncbi:hypothetical protein [Oscillatoria nigro-viridis]|uniref:hypothetical protein n=1 Tax=Phormidium nigroviride TaxID=482564 RepID=UPI00167FB104|nr:hypothetical protein [Oscillatoria nigro-viridis]
MTYNLNPEQLSSSAFKVPDRPHPYRQRSQQGAIGTQKKISWCQLNMIAANA